MLSEARSWEQGARSGRRERRVIRVKGSASRGGESSTRKRMRVRTSTTARHPLSGKRERLPYNGISDCRSILLHAPRSLLLAPCSLLLALCPSRPGDEAELVVLL